MKVIATIFFLLSITTTEIVAHFNVFDECEMMILDSLNESEKDSENETSEDEKEKDFKEIISLFLVSGCDNYLLDYNSCSDLVQSTYKEVIIPPPDFN